ncbi:PaaI family thioesterase [Myxococcota bacterium]|nr:PaaI family thioesterase [Myxococcota bacterium]
MTPARRPIDAKIRHRSAPCHDLLGRRVISATAGTSELTFDVGESFTNGMGNIQGGFLAAMLDSAMGAALSTVLEEGERPPTVEMKINFIKPAKPGTLRGTARVVHRGRSVVFVEGDLHDDSASLLARGTSTNIILLRPSEKGSDA